MNMLTITDNAAKQIQHITGAPGIPMIKLSVKPGGCFGFTYNLETATHEQYKDQILSGELRVLTNNNISVLMDNSTFVSVVGLVMDFEGGFNGRGFTYENPSATKCCHCGISFSNK